MSGEDKAAFTPEDIRALRLLVVSLGIVGAGLFWVAPDHPLLIAGLIGGMIVTSIVAIHLIRRLRRGP
jgi:hypothetical protein